jgi:RNA polymerase sigma-70 factor (ECF subfamily)
VTAIRNAAVTPHTFSALKNQAGLQVEQDLALYILDLQGDNLSSAVQSLVCKDGQPALYYPERRQFKPRGTVERYPFDQEYLERLAAGDAEVGRHFATYFGEMLLIKLRGRLKSPQAIADLRQETFVRVIRTLQKKDGITYPERFGGFVNSVCENVLLEFFRSGKSTFQIPEDSPEPVDTSGSAESELITEERKRLVAKLLSQLSEKDRQVLRGVYLDEKDKDQLCEELKISRSNLRIRVHRALARFRSTFQDNEQLSRTASAG